MDDTLYHGNMSAPSRVPRVVSSGIPIAFADAARIAGDFMWRVEWERPGDGSGGRAKLVIILEVERAAGGVDRGLFGQALAEAEVAASILREMDARIPVA